MPYDHEQCRYGQKPRSYRKLKWAVLTFHSRFQGHALIYQPSTMFTVRPLDSVSLETELGSSVIIFLPKFPYHGCIINYKSSSFFFKQSPACKFQLWTRIMEGMKFVFISDSSQKMNIQESIYSLPLLYSWNNKFNF